MNFTINPKFKKDEKSIKNILDNFSVSGQNFDDRKRNQIKLFDFEGKTINVKSFKKPNFINKIIYRYFRKSKARRSFEYANRLLEKGIGTPQPIAYFENFDFAGLKDSYYISEHLHCDLTFRELVENVNYPDFDKILRQFTRFSYDLHQKGIDFKDHSPGNTLIKKNEKGDYDFYLVDLNRMAFHGSMSFEKRMKNLSRLTPHQDMIAVMSNEYAQLSGESETKVFNYLWAQTAKFQYRFFMKKVLKSKFKKS
ncbi:MAG: lipopolysaccharide kinase InaA family protein [Flavobacteriaceae bacterium]|jgi:hypothetical protein|nr:lipopolysaccharide kinase InaA family protein [Flavobacteriaceae bacterium]